MTQTTLDSMHHYIPQFEFIHEGEKYYIEADVLLFPKLSFDKHSADSRDDLDEEFYVESLYVIDGDGLERTEEMNNIDVPTGQTEASKFSFLGIVPSITYEFKF